MAGERDPYDAGEVDGETFALVERLERELAAGPAVHTLPPQVIRDAREAGRGIWGPVVRSAMATERVLDGVPVRWFRPEVVNGVYLHLHGGGWMLGRAHDQDQRNEHIARSCGLAVVSVDYRLAPEHAYPAGPDDCEKVARWLVDNAARELGTDRIVIGGESAGAHLSVVTMLRLRDRLGYRGFAGANLLFGAFDLSMTPSQRRWGDRNLVLSTPILDWFYDAFVPAERRREPDVSPMYADLSSLPPALFTVGTADPLLDDSLFLHARWRAAGNAADLAIVPGAPHGFTAFPMPATVEATTRIDAFLRGV
jgi:acetyl esterase/lipase